MLFKDSMSKVDGNENNGNTLEEDPLMSNEDEDHHDLFEFFCILQFTSKNSKLLWCSHPI
jgi:hypothetical protein